MCLNLVKLVHIAPCIPSIPCKEGATRCAGCLCSSLGWFKHIEPHRTYTNDIITEIARCGEVYHMRSGWFDCTEPSLSTSLQGKQGVQGAYATSSNLLTTHHLYRCVEFYHSTGPLYLQQSRKFRVCRVVVHLFGVVQAHRTSSKTYTNHIITEITRFIT